MKTVYQVLEEMLGEEQGRLILASILKNTEQKKIERHVAVLEHILCVLPVEEAGKEL